MRGILSFLLLLLFTVYATPREVWHAFSGHEDTIHHNLSGVFIEPQHHHCDVLQFEQHIPFDGCFSSPLWVTPSLVYFTPLRATYASVNYSYAVKLHKPLRAPPSA